MAVFGTVPDTSVSEPVTSELTDTTTLTEVTTMPAEFPIASAQYDGFMITGCFLIFCFGMIAGICIAKAFSFWKW